MWKEEGRISVLSACPLCLSYQYQTPAHRVVSSLLCLVGRWTIFGTVLCRTVHMCAGDCLGSLTRSFSFASFCLVIRIRVRGILHRVLFFLIPLFHFLRLLRPSTQTGICEYQITSCSKSSHLLLLYHVL